MSLESILKKAGRYGLALGIGLLSCGNQRSEEEMVCWRRNYDEKMIHQVQQTEEGGYIGVGANRDGAWIIKLNKFGNKEWERVYGGSDYNGFYSIQQTLDGGYVMAGEIMSEGAGESDGWVVKLDRLGYMEWEKVLGGSEESEDDGFKSIQQTLDGGYVAAGYTRSKGAGGITGFDGWVVKLDKGGYVRWEKVLGGSESDSFISVEQTLDGGYVAGGSTRSKGAGGKEGWVVKLDNLGEIEWEKTYGGSEDDYFISIQQALDGGYVAAGNTMSKGAGENDGWMVKLDKDRELEWEKVLGGSDYDWFNSIQQTLDGGYVAAGGTYSRGAGEYDGWMVKLDKDRELEWEKVLGGSDDDWFNSIQQTLDGGYVVAGNTVSEGTRSFGGWVVKMDEKGEVCE